MCVWSQLVNVSGFSLQAVPVSEAALLHWHLLHLRHPVLRPSRDHHPLLRVPRARALGVGSGPVRAHRAGLPDVWVELRELPCLFIPKGHPASRASHEGELALESTGSLACSLFPSWGVSWWWGELMTCVLYRTWEWGPLFIYQHAMKRYRGSPKLQMLELLFHMKCDKSLKESHLAISIMSTCYFDSAYVFDFSSSQFCGVTVCPWISFQAPWYSSRHFGV